MTKGQLLTGEIGTQEALLPQSPSIPTVSIRVEKDLESWERELLATAGLSDLAETEAWTVQGTNRQVSYSTHGLFRYFGKFPPPIARKLIEDHTQPGGIVWDPTAGSGTTGVECLLLQRSCHLRDVNPLSLLLCRVKPRRLDYDEVIAAIRRVATRYRPLGETEYEYQAIGLRNASHWFLSSTADSLRGLRKVIEEEKNEEVQDFLWVAFASTVRRASRATTQQGRLFLDKTTALEDALDQFVKRATAGASAVSSLPERNGTSLNIENHDLRDSIDVSPDQRPDLVIVHPPYFNAYRYSSINSLELSWLGHSHSDVRKSEMREFFKVGKAERVSLYVEDMALSLTNVANIMPSTTAMGLMIGDTVLKGEYIPTTRQLLDAISESNLFTVEKVALRVPRFTEATWVASQRRLGSDVGIKLCDFVITLRRRG